jgi:5-hydroxyisourate hydrolase
MNATEQAGNTLSTHVLDTSLGRPAAGVPVTLERGTGEVLGDGVTDADGRVRNISRDGVSLGAGTYRLRFNVDAYFAQDSRASFYPEITILFCVGAGGEHYHVPLLLSAFGYSTYRGS